MATLTRGQTYGATETITNTKLHNLVDLGSVSSIVNADISASAAIADTKLADITTGSKVNGTAITNLAGVPAGAGALDEVNGGTGQTSITTGDLLYGSASNVLSKLAADSNATRYLANTGTSNIPTWDKVELSNGAKISSQATGDLIVASSATAFTRKAIGANNTILASDGTTVQYRTATCFQSAFLARLTDDTTTPATYDETGGYDINSDFASSTFTAPVSGRYQFNVAVRGTATNSSVRGFIINIRKNGSIVQTSNVDFLGNGSTSIANTGNLVVTLNLAASDAITVTITTNGTKPTIGLNDITVSYWSGFLVPTTLTLS